ncbi:MAG: hypothetical protein U0528_01575 [Anaerolineae bacterium]
MIRFCCGGLLALLVNALLIATAVTWGRQHEAENSLRQLGFALCDQQPCFRGYKFNEISGITAHPIALSEVVSLRVETLAPAALVVHWKYDRSGRGYGPTLGEVIAVYGQPCAYGPSIYSRPTMKQRAVYFPYVSMMMTFEKRSGARPTQRIESLRLETSATNCEDCRFIALSYCPRWKGFTERYPW